jgi:hypothetical protein
MDLQTSAQPYIVLFNICAFAVVWLELKRQQARQHDVVQLLTKQYAGLVLVLMDHGQRLSSLEGSPFRPATILEKFDADAQDLETQHVIEEITALLNRKRERKRA